MGQGLGGVEGYTNRLRMTTQTAELHTRSGMDGEALTDTVGTRQTDKPRTTEHKTQTLNVSGKT